MSGLAGGLAVAFLLAAAAAVTLTDRCRAPRRWRLAARTVQADRRAGEGTSPPDPDSGLQDPAMMMELIGAMLDAGAGLGRSLELVARHAAPRLRQHLDPVVAALAIGADWETAWRSSHAMPDELLALRDALGFAAVTGAPSAAMLYAQASRLRREQFRAAERRAAALGVRLVVPLGLCSLPAFVCLGIVPVLLAMLPPGI